MNHVAAGSEKRGEDERILMHAQRALASVGRCNHAEPSTPLGSVEPLLLVTRLDPALDSSQYEMKYVRRGTSRCVLLLVTKPRPRRHAPELSGVAVARPTGPVFVPQPALSHVRDDLRIPVRVALNVRPRPEQALVQELQVRETIGQRCLLSFVDEAVRARADGVLRKDRDGDVGAVFGLGFPPFLGGPLRLIHNEGPGSIVERMRRLELEPSAALLEWAGPHR